MEGLDIKRPAFAGGEDDDYSDHDSTEYLPVRL